MRRTTLGATIALALALVPAGAALAQDTAVPHPSHIHTGVCPAPGDVVFPLSDVGAIPGDAMGLGSAIAVEAGMTTVESTLADLLASEHSIVVHHSADDMATYLVCGDIGGNVMGGTDIAIGLGPVGGSGYSGVAWLKDNGDGTTSVNVFITESGATAAA